MAGQSTATNRSVDEPQGSVAPTSSVLSTMNADGSRRWLRPRLSVGRFLTARRVVAYLLIAVFALLPIVHVAGRPIVLLDIAARRFHILGTTFYPTDTLPLALLLVGAFLTIFWVTALAGRVWCGWACPQTVYMEFVYRPLERFFEGSPGRAKRGWLQTSGFGKVAKYAVYLGCSLLLAHTFLAYFVSWDELGHWVFGTPFRHPVGFGVVMIVTAGMMFNFGFFREQLCLVACPYGRFQSVLLDRHSVIVGYDKRRGEPRGAARGAKREVSLPVHDGAKGCGGAGNCGGDGGCGGAGKCGVAGGSCGSGRCSGTRVLGDCVDCKLCVVTCPTGIDIRNGLQMECINCAQCIDACDSVMTKLGRPTGLIRYSSQAAVAGEVGGSKVLRPRVVLYPLALLVILGLFVSALLGTGAADITVMRGLGQPFTVFASGQVSNPVRVKIVNRLDREADFALSLAGNPAMVLATEAEGATLNVPAGAMVTVPARILAPLGAFSAGHATAMIRVDGPGGFCRNVEFSLLGPATDQARETDDGRGGERDDEHKQGHEAPKATGLESKGKAAAAPAGTAPLDAAGKDKR